jgi:hypothetical protein
MEIIINLIIFLVIIFSVIKRLKDVSEKGEKLEAPPPAVPKTGREEIPKTMEAPRKGPGAREVLKELFKELEEASQGKPLEQVEQAEQVELQQTATPIPIPIYSEDTLERIQEAPIQPTEVDKPLLPDYVKKAPMNKHVPEFQLSFSSSDTVMGIVMSEILGPPVSLKNL